MFLVKIGILQVFQLLKYVKIGFCRGEGEAASYLTLPQLVEGLKLEERTRSISYLLLLLTVQSITCFCSPWGVFEVDVENMRGVERGLDWVLHHLAKKRYIAQFTEFYPFMLLSFRRDWSYHSSQGKA